MTATVIELAAALRDQLEAHRCCFGCLTARSGRRRCRCSCGGRLHALLPCPPADAAGGKEEL